MTDIEVERVSSEAAAQVFRVTLVEDPTSSEHLVTVTSPAPEIADRYPSIEAFVRTCFEFLLAREPKESILPSFEIREIGRYFPQWERELGG